MGFEGDGEGQYTSLDGQKTLNLTRPTLIPKDDPRSGEFRMSKNDYYFRKIFYIDNNFSPSMRVARNDEQTNMSFWGFKSEDACIMYPAEKFQTFELLPLKELSGLLSSCPVIQLKLFWTFFFASDITGWSPNRPQGCLISYNSFEKNLFRCEFRSQVEAIL